MVLDPSHVELGERRFGERPSTNDDASAAQSKLRSEANEPPPSTPSSLAKPAFNRIERYVDELCKRKPDKASEVEWLFAVDITTKDFKSGDNVDRRTKELEKLAEKFKDKGVAIVAQAAVCDVPNPDDKLYRFVVPNPYHIERYIIYDGKITKVDSVNSSGCAGDVKHLLSLGTDHFKAKKVGLWIDSHGIGNPGLGADTGTATMAELAKAIKDGLRGQKLDLLNFDSCLMAQNGVLDALRPVTDRIVASAEREGGMGQDLVAPMEKLAANPKITPEEFAESLIETARLQPVFKEVARREPTNLYDWFDLLMQRPDKAPKTVAVQTLAHFDLSKYPSFRTELDHLGDALAKAVADPRNRYAIDSIIRETPGYGMFSEKRDLKCFVEAVMQAVGNGKISDPEGKIRIHGGRVLDSHKLVVKSYSGFDNFTARGGLSTYIPPRYDLDFHRRSRLSVKACAFTTEIDDLKLLSENKPAYVKYLQNKLAEMKKEVPTDRPADDEITEVKTALEKTAVCVEKISAAKGEKETILALDELRKSSQELEKTSFYQQKLLAVQQRIKKGIDRQFQSELVSPSNGWGRFKEALRRLD